MRTLAEKGPPCAIGRTVEGGRVFGIYCRFGGWLRDGGAADVLSRDYTDTISVESLVSGGHIVGVERGRKPVAVPYVDSGPADEFLDATAFRKHFSGFGVEFFLLWDGVRWVRSRPALATAFSDWCPVVGRHTKNRRKNEPEATT